jgi:hypothetical protein
MARRAAGHLTLGQLHAEQPQMGRLLAVSREELMQVQRLPRQTDD